MLFYDFKSGISLGTAQKAIKELPLPIVPFNRGFLSFAPIHQLQDCFGPDLPLERLTDRLTDDFLDDGWPDQRLLTRDARLNLQIWYGRALMLSFKQKGFIL